jgi:hypothetical protein
MTYSNNVLSELSECDILTFWHFNWSSTRIILTVISTYVDALQAGHECISRAVTREDGLLDRRLHFTADGFESQIVQPPIGGQSDTKLRLDTSIFGNII